MSLPSARSVAHAIPGLCHVRAWQCSGCRAVYFGRHKEECPGCGRLGYWTGSVDPVALAAAEARRPHLEACDAVTAAILADREAVRQACAEADVACPVCGAAADENCRRRSGTPMGAVHRQRVRAIDLL